MLLLLAIRVTDTWTSVRVAVIAQTIFRDHLVNTHLRTPPQLYKVYLIPPERKSVTVKLVTSVFKRMLFDMKILSILLPLYHYYHFHSHPF
jgi:hypothetical protein